ncbi:WXG100 family type VII secretion target [Mumia sp. zg.B53]|nr:MULTISPECIES: WXG100 family type VII secretion target [unclassified Mumia]MBW9213411.1 WXG100 family type VII secretion target [Mumia sp. zg.B53]MDD9349475.1 WXG100 family type VII secretion target [Mumia sp.]
MTYQLRVDHAAIEQAGADLGSYAGTIEDYRDSLRAEAARALGVFGGGVGSEEHEAAMRVVDRLVEEHVASVREQRTGVGEAGDTFVSAGARMRAVLGAGGPR